MMEETWIFRDGRDAIARALDALEAAREMPRGAERTRALKEAGRLRYIADLQGMVVVRRGRPPKTALSE
jgi:hypothetical protein